MVAHRIPPAEGHVARQPWQERLLALLRNTVLIALGLLMMWLVGDVIFTVFAGIFLAVFLRGLSERVSRHTRLPIGLSLAVVIAAILVVIAGVGYFLWPRTSEQLNQLATQLPQQFHRIEAEIAQTSWGKALIEQFRPATGGAQQAVVGRVFGVATSTIGSIAAVVVVFFVGLYLAADPETYLAGALRLVPPPRRRRVADMLIETASALWWRLIGRIFSMAIIAVMTTVGLALLGVPLALTLGLLSGVLSFVPYIGAASPGDSSRADRADRWHDADALRHRALYRRPYRRGIYPVPGHAAAHGAAALGAGARGAGGPRQPVRRRRARPGDAHRRRRHRRGPHALRRRRARRRHEPAAAGAAPGGVKELKLGAPPAARRRPGSKGRKAGFPPRRRRLAGGMFHVKPIDSC